MISAEISREFSKSELATAFEEASPSFQLDAVVAEYAEILRESYWARGSSLEEVLTLAQRVKGLLRDDPDVTEFADLVMRAEQISAQDR